MASSIQNDDKNVLIKIYLNVFQKNSIIRTRTILFCYLCTLLRLCLRRINYCKFKEILCNSATHSLSSQLLLKEFKVLRVSQLRFKKI